MALANEFPRPIPSETLPDGGTAFDIAATPEERRALAVRLGLIGLESLTARGRVERLPPGGLVRVSGWLEAAAVQACVVTLDPVAATLRAPLERLYGAAAAESGGPTVDPEDPEADEIEPLPEGGVIDVGEVVAEELALVLDPYPRAPGALDRAARLLGPGISLNAPDDTPERPFAGALRRHRVN